MAIHHRGVGLPPRGTARVDGHPARAEHADVVRRAARAARAGGVRDAAHAGQPSAGPTRPVRQHASGPVLPRRHRQRRRGRCRRPAAAILRTPHRRRSPLHRVAPARRLHRELPRAHAPAAPTGGEPCAHRGGPVRRRRGAARTAGFAPRPAAARVAPDGADGAVRPPWHRRVHAPGRRPAVGVPTGRVRLPPAPTGTRRAPPDGGGGRQQRPAGRRPSAVQPRPVLAMAAVSRDR